MARKRRFSPASFFLVAASLAAIIAAALYLPPTRPALERSGPIVAPSPAPVNPDTVTLNAVGDVMLSRKVGKLITLNGLEYPMAQVADVLADGDLTFANLECPISQQGKPLPGKQITFRAEPAAVNCLRQAGIDIVSLANNHAVDYDSPALLETIDLLSQMGISSVGGGMNLNQARQPVIIDKKGMKIAFLAYSDLADVYFDLKYRRMHRASDTLPGVAPLEMEFMLEDIAKARTLADRVIVSLHWGTEYRDTPSREQKEMAHKLIEAGADAIIGHHPHWFQGLEVYQGKIIAYSLGNFVMDQNWSNETREGLFLQLLINRDGTVKARTRPVFIKESQPQWVEGDYQERLINRVVSLSAKLNTPATINGEWVEYGP